MHTKTGQILQTFKMFQLTPSWLVNNNGLLFIDKNIILYPFVKYYSYNLTSDDKIIILEDFYNFQNHERIFVIRSYLRGFP